VSAKNALTLIEPLLQDPQINEILIDNHTHVYVEKQGKLLDVPSPFESEAQVYALIEALAAQYGARVDESSPFADLHLPDSSHIHIVIPPVAVTGPSLTIRKFSQNPLKMDDLLRYHCLSPEMAAFLRACVQIRCNILVSGGTGSGKTTVLRILAECIPAEERIVVLQNQDVLGLRAARLVCLRIRQPDRDGRGGVTARHLVENALQMRPDNIVVTGLGGEEAFDLIEAMNAGYDGVLMGMHASNARDALERLEVMARLGKPSFPPEALRQKIAAALNIVTHQDYLSDGTRKIVSISEVRGVENGAILLNEIFVFQQTGMADGKITGVFLPTGYKPSFLAELEAVGIMAEMFTLSR